MGAEWTGTVVAAALAAAAARSDMETGKIYNAHVVPGLLFGLLLGYLRGDLYYCFISALMAGTGPFIFWLLGKAGGGDFKIALALGALVGAHVGIFAFIFAWLIAFVVYMVKHLAEGSAGHWLSENFYVMLSFFNKTGYNRDAGEEVCFGVYLFYGLFLAEIFVKVVGN
ncbi:A24 family peptidase [Pelotomaculum terephthalicicum JT]|uniref:prepilin peptidase n=1 Tax=Pelotomaculum TaxID=191373 RepID=UPI0009C5BAE4|nr:MULTISPECIES: prepilin peptidase [Pelotomaculum]MCG9969615.1 A24 family peptidase [Pelotomaculum terephthalicicum JT]OPX91762.1 MAG: Type IV leader peptidase family protein [Pelotomaculum sp. PtaB.Bin117]OPY58623.1 MAG: Type IV leader peptidase family protein [Pelotomaculum sp. PtaU1.Bin065]